MAIHTIILLIAAAWLVAMLVAIGVGLYALRKNWRLLESVHDSQSRAWQMAHKKARQRP